LDLACLRSYLLTGEPGGYQGVKLEQHVYVGDDAVDVLSNFPSMKV
jgi:hypothetical protein